MRYVISPKTDVSRIPKDADSVHLVRPPKLGKLEKLLKRCKIDEVWLSASCRNRLSVKARKLLREKGVKLRAAKNRGRAIEIDMEKIMQVVEMHKDERSYREIEKATGIPKSTAHYLIKYADRAKVRSGSHIVYLE